MWWIKLSAILVGDVWALQVIGFMGMLAFTYVRDWSPFRSASRSIAILHKHGRRRTARQDRGRQRQLAEA